MKRKILRNMCALLLLALFVAYSLFCLMMYRQNVRTVKMQLREEAIFLEVAMERMGQPYLEDLPIDASDSKRITFIDVDGTVLYDTDEYAAKMENHIARPEIRQAMETGSGEAERYSDTLQKKTFYYAFRMSSGQILRVALATESVYGTMWGQFSLLALLACVLFALSMLAADRLARRIVEPVNNLDLQHPLENSGYDELSPLLLRLERQNQQIAEQMENLRARQAEFTAITENMQEGLVLLNRQLQVVSINESAKKVLGIRQGASQEGISRNAQEPAVNAEPLHILMLNRRQDLLEAVKAAQAGDAGHCTMEHEGRQYSLLASPVVRGERGGGVVIFLLDVTEQMEAERVRREFSANVSHELKTPLTSISGYAEIMKSGLVKDEDMPRFAGRIHKEARRLIALIEDIIQLSRIEEGPADWQWELVDLKELCQEVADRLAAKADSRQVSVEVTGTGACVNGVRRLLEEMVSNLCDNSIKYNREGGRVVMNVQRDDGQVRLMVADNGIGIPAEHQGRIFERFYRVDKSHSRETGGTGLGLSIVKHAAAIHGAQIQLDSDGKNGTCITVCFPEDPESKATC